MDLLNEIQHETAREFVFDVRRQTAPLGSTDIDALEAHLRRTLAPDVPLGFSASVQRGDVFEIAGPASSGKTHLLYWLVMQCILPRDLVLSSSSAGAALRSENTSTGWGKVAVVCDCDGRWNARRLHALLVARLRRLALDHTNINTSLDDIARTALKRLVVFHLGDTLSSAQLAATLTALPDYLRTQRPSEELGLLAIDTISATYVQDRWRSELDTHTPSSLTLALHALKRLHAPLTVLANTTTNTSPPQGGYAPPPNRVLVDSPLLVTHQISLALGVIPKFPAEMTAAEALRDTLRREIVERGIIIAKVRTLREPDTVEAQFKFEIHPDEIVVSEAELLA